jgi:hydrogenase nickel incorporation protein HypA/HybF
MHELSISSAIVDTVIRHAGGRRVSIVRLQIGTLRQVVPSSLSFYFEITGRDTVCDGARLELELIDALLRCRECEQQWDPAPRPLYEGDPAALLPRFRCPRCEAAGAEILAGNELLVDSIDVEESPDGPALAATGPAPDSQSRQPS